VRACRMDSREILLATMRILSLRAGIHGGDQDEVGREGQAARRAADSDDSIPPLLTSHPQKQSLTSTLPLPAPSAANDMKRRARPHLSSSTCRLLVPHPNYDR